MDHHGVCRRGVLHVGGHEGQELELYLCCGFERILYVEPNPAVHQRLEQRLAFWREWLTVMRDVYGAQHLPTLASELCAASDVDGTACLHLTEHDQQSSLLPPLAPFVHGVAETEVTTQRLDTLLDARHECGAFNTLTLDVQGAELRVLNGCPKLLEQIEMAIVEVNFRRRYSGSALAHEVEDFMESRNFRAVLRNQPLPWAPAADVVFIRRGG